MIQPSFAVYIKEGEVLTQVQLTDAEEAEEELKAGTIGQMLPTGERKKITPYQRKYKAAFKKVKNDFKKKDGTWKKGGFRAAVKAAHRIAGGGK
jgi:hypothetical protein